MNNGFDKLAAPYRWMEYLSFGRALERCRFRFLPGLSHTRNALLLGDGDGRFTAALLRHAPAAQALAIDNSSAMLAALRQRCERDGTGGRLAFHHADLSQGLPKDLRFAPPATEVTHPGPVSQSCTERTSGLRTEHHPTIEDRPRQSEAADLEPCRPGQREAQPSGTFDLIATHFLLDCLTDAQVDRLTADVTAHSAADTQWIVSEFRIPPTGPMRPVSRLVVRSLYAAFRLLTGLPVQRLPDYHAVLQRHGWQLAEHHRPLGGLLSSERWQREPNPGRSVQPATTPSPRA